MKKFNKAQLEALKIQANRVKMVTRAIDHKLRFDILNALLSKGKMTVTELYVLMRIEQSVMSQHLAIMRRQGLVETAREGKFIYYSPNHEALHNSLTNLQGIANYLEMPTGVGLLAA